MIHCPHGSGLTSHGPWLTARWVPEPEARAWRVYQESQELEFAGRRELGTGILSLCPFSLSHSFLPGPHASAREWAAQALSEEEWFRWVMGRVPPSVTTRVPPWHFWLVLISLSQLGRTLVNCKEAQLDSRTPLSPTRTWLWLLAFLRSRAG